MGFSWFFQFCYSTAESVCYSMILTKTHYGKNKSPTLQFCSFFLILLFYNWVCYSTILTKTGYGKNKSPTVWFFRFFLFYYEVFKEREIVSYICNSYFAILQMSIYKPLILSENRKIIKRFSRIETKTLYNKNESPMVQFFWFQAPILPFSDSYNFYFTTLRFSANMFFKIKAT